MSDEQRSQDRPVEVVSQRLEGTEILGRLLGSLLCFLEFGVRDVASDSSHASRVWHQAYAAFFYSTKAALT